MPKVVDRSKWTLLDRGRDQKGWIERAGNLTYGAFRTRWKLPDGSERDWRERLELGPTSMGVKVAERLLIKKIDEFFESQLNAAGMAAKVTPDSTFAWLLEKAQEVRSGDWKANTLRVNKMYLQILREKLGHIPIRDFGTVEMQDYLRGWLLDMATKGMSRSYIQHLLIYLRAALNEGVKRQLLHYNYASELKMPARTKAVDQRFLTEEQVAALIRHFRQNGQRRDGLILQIFYLCALRPGELFALRWNDWDPSQPHILRVDEAFGKSGLEDPKTNRSKGPVYLPQGLQSELAAWGEWCGDINPDAFIFESKTRNSDKIRQLPEAGPAAGGRGMRNRRANPPDAKEILLDGCRGQRGVG